MEILSNILVPHTEVIGKGAVGVTFLQMLSPALILNDIRKKRSAKNFSVIPFLGGIVVSLLSLKAGSLMRDDNVIQINFIGLALHIVYVSIFFFYAIGKDRFTAWLQTGAVGAFCTAVLVYTEFEDPAKVEFRLAMIVGSVLFILFGMPFLSLGEIIRRKSVDGLPLPLIVAGALVTFMWFLYGLCINNTVMIAQNAGLLLMSIIQLSLFVIYPSSKPDKVITSKKKKSVKKTN